MGEFLPRNKKERVKEVDELGEEVPGVENCKKRFFCISRNTKLFLCH